MAHFDALLDRLAVFYGVLPSPPADAFALYVWEVLSAHTVPHRRDAAMAALRKIPALTPDAVRRAPQARIEAAVRLAGAYLDQRLEALSTGVEAFRRRRQLPDTVRGPLGAARRALEPLPQLGEAGRRRMLLFAGGHLVLPVDAGIARVVARLGLSEVGRSRRALRSARRALFRRLPPDVDAYRRAVVYLGHHAGGMCAELEPHCTVCPVLSACSFRTPRTEPWDSST